MSHQRTARLADDVRMRNPLRVADIGNVIDDVVGVLLKRVIGRTVEGAAGSVVVHAQTATDIHELNGETHLLELRVETRGLLDGLLHGQDVRNLRADVEVQQFETSRQIL